MVESRNRMEEMKEVLKKVSTKDRIYTNLKHNFELAKQEPMFQFFVDTLNLKEEMLMHYTSIMEDCAIECNRCKNCKNLLSCQNKIKGYAYTPQNIEGNLEFNYLACRYQQKYLQEHQYLNHISLYSIPKEIKEARLKDVYIDDKKRFPAIKKMNEFLSSYRKNKTGQGMYLYGSFGSGKTYLIAALLNELAKENNKSAIVFWPEFLRDLKTSFQTGYCEKFDAVKKAPLLLIDDIGAEVVTEWNRDEILSPLLQYRMQEKLPTFFTSNLSIHDLEEHLSMTKGNVDQVKARRVIERVKQLTEEVKMVSKNLR